MPGPKEAISLLLSFYADNPVRLLTFYDGKKSAIYAVLSIKNYIFGLHKNINLKQ